MGSSLFLLRCFTIAVFVWSGHGADFSVKSGEFLSYQIRKDVYVTDHSAKVQRVSFNFTTENDYPELPSWLRLEQRAVEDQAFIYGAPNFYDENVTIEIIGWDKDDYSTERIQRRFIVQPKSNKEDFPWYQAEFLIKNRNLDMFLENGEQKNILQIVKEKYWSASDLMVTRVESALARGGRIPLPNSNKKEGVYVRVGSRESWGSANTTLQTGKKPVMDYFHKDIEQYEINWSNFSWLDLHNFPDPEAQRQKLLPEDKIVATTEYVPREFDDSARNFKDDVVLVIVIPIIVILILVLLLSIIMCLGREGRRRRDHQTPSIQLTHHHNIQRSTLRLRELSKPVEGEQTTSEPPYAHEPSRPRQGEYERLTVPGDHDEHDDDGTDGREFRDGSDGRNAPPPYRMPPSQATAGAQQV